MAMGDFYGPRDKREAITPSTAASSLAPYEELIGSTLEENLRIVARLEMIATRKGVMPCQHVLAGAERQLELEKNLLAQELKLTSDDLAELNAVTPSAAA